MHKHNYLFFFFNFVLKTEKQYISWLLVIHWMNYTEETGGPHHQIQWFFAVVLK